MYTGCRVTDGRRAAGGVSVRNIRPQRSRSPHSSRFYIPTCRFVVICFTLWALKMCASQWCISRAQWCMLSAQWCISRAQWCISRQQWCMYVECTVMYFLCTVMYFTCVCKCAQADDPIAWRWDINSLEQLIFGGKLANIMLKFSKWDFLFVNVSIRLYNFVRK
jgi:hypothetical protein